VILHAKNKQSKNEIKKIVQFVAGCQWLKPVILATWEADWENLGSRPAGQIVQENPSPK
jgi:hypothetical protein